VGIAASLLAAGKISRTGVLLPVSAEIYNPPGRVPSAWGSTSKNVDPTWMHDERSYWGD
jgi:hypothetical protein